MNALAAASRDGHLALRRVERQQVLIEHLHTHPGAHPTLADLAHLLQVSPRTIARDVERLRDSGVPLVVRPGRGGGVRLARIDRVLPVQFDVAEVAALLSSLAVLGPTSTSSANSAAFKLTAALRSATGG